MKTADPGGSLAMSSRFCEKYCLPKFWGMEGRCGHHSWPPQVHAWVSAPIYTLHIPYTHTCARKRAHTHTHRNFKDFLKRINLKILNYIILVVILVHVLAHVCYTIPSHRRQSTICWRFCLLPCEAWWLNSCHETWQQMPLSPKLSQHLSIKLFIKYS